MRLDGKRTIVTGGAGGIGGAIARRMAAAGARIMIADLNGDKARETATALGAGHISTDVDVAALDSVEAMVASAERQMDGVDVLVHCAGVAMLRDVLEVPPAEWKRVIDINLMGTYYACLAVARAMVARKSGGSLITIASAAAARPSRGASAYGAAKGGVVTLTKALAVDLASRNIRVNSICPGLVETPMAARIRKGAPPNQRVVQRLSVLGRMAEPEEIAKVALFLASDDSSFATGAPFIIDAGWTVS